MALLGVFVAPALLCGGEPDVDPSKPNVIEEILGFWEITRGVNQGKPLTEEERDDTLVQVKRYMMITYDRDQNQKYRVSFTIDDSTKPMQIDLLSLVKGQPPQQSLGIIEIEKDKWRICYSLPGEPRPTSFESESGSKSLLFVHRPKNIAPKKVAPRVER